MNNELETTLKVVNALSNMQRTLLEQLSKVLDVLLKDRDNMKKEEIEKYEKLQNTTNVFIDHLKNDGSRLVSYTISESDKELVDQVLKQNDEAFISFSNNDGNKEFKSKFKGDHFAFENLAIKMPDGSYTMYIKDQDVTKFSHLVNFLNEEKYSHNIDLVKKDVSNILSIDDTKALMSLEIRKDETFEKIANALNINKIPFEVANLENGQRIIYEADNIKNVNDIIDNLKDINVMERSDLLMNKNKEFNNRTQAQTMVTEMLKDSAEDSKDSKERD